MPKTKPRGSHCDIQQADLSIGRGAIAAGIIMILKRHVHDDNFIFADPRLYEAPIVEMKKSNADERKNEFSCWITFRRLYDVVTRAFRAGHSLVDYLRQARLVGACPKRQ